MVDPGDGLESAEDRLGRLSEDLSNLEGFGRPIAGLDGVRDPAWWAKKYVNRIQALDRLDELHGSLDEQLIRIGRIGDPAERRNALDALRAEIQALNARVDPSERIPLPELRGGQSTTPT